jgi:hypothetical protein
MGGSKSVDRSLDPLLDHPLAHTHFALTWGFTSETAPKVMTQSTVVSTPIRPATTPRSAGGARLAHRNRTAPALG